MFYLKNLPAWERAIRIGAGLALAFASLQFAVGWPFYLGAVSGTCLTLSGIFGFCPACALYGRRLPFTKRS